MLVSRYSIQNKKQEMQNQNPEPLFSNISPEKNLFYKI